ncbi:MAG: hypothetical protein RL215_2565 [Planctomycetota bacterium]
MSSMQFEVSGRSSLTGTPLWPQGLKRKGEGRSPAVLRSVRRSAWGGRCPAYLRSEGLGSKKSPWKGPPFMKRWITRRARGGKCVGGLAE